MRVLAVVLAFAMALPARLAAQGACSPGPQSNEAKTLGILSVPLAFSAAGAPLAEPRKMFRVGVVVSSVPNVDARTSTPTICRPGKGPENTNLLSAVPQPRISLAIPGLFEVEASWIPPVRVNEVKANLFSLALSKTLPIASGTFAARVRAHATFGVIHAPITCSDAALKDSASECFNGTRSNDSYHPNILGADVSLGWSPPGSRLHPYLGGGYNRLQPRFQVNFTNSVGDIDRTKVQVDLNRLVVFGGATWLISRSVDVTGELYASPSDALTVQFGLRAGL